jgi:hypothetical protein
MTTWRSAVSLGVRRARPSPAALIWAATYVTLWASGFRMSSQGLRSQWQLLPLDELTARPLATVWRMHIQPPLWNLLVGLLGRWSPLTLTVSLQLVMLAAGMALAGSVASVGRRLGLGPRLAVGIAVIATVNAPIVDAAFRPQYELPVAALLALAVRAAGRSTSAWLPVTSILLAAVVLTRSLYHPVLLVMLGVLVARAARIPRRRWATAALPLVVVGGWMVRQQVMFGTASVSSWTGMNLLRAVGPALNDDQLQAVSDDLSPVAAVGPFHEYMLYEPFVETCKTRASDPVLNVPQRQTGDVGGVFAPRTAPNFNFECFLPLYDLAAADARRMIAEHPGAYVRGRVWAINNWASGLPAEPRDSPLTGLLRVTSDVVLLDVPHPGLPASWDRSRFWVHDVSISLTVVVSWGIVLTAGARRAWWAVRRRSADSAELTWLVLATLAWWTVLVGVLFELGEQERLRLPADPLVFVAAAAVIDSWWQRCRSVATPAQDGGAANLQ